MSAPLPTPDAVPPYITLPLLRPDHNPPPPTSEKAKALRGELFHAFVPDLVRERARCGAACDRFNAQRVERRRKQVQLIRDILQDPTPLPTPLPAPEEDDAQFSQDPWIEPPFRADYGTNVHFGANVFVNFNSVIIDSAAVHIGSRTLVGPNVYFYTGFHPLDPKQRNGTVGPEGGREIVVEEDCWLGGNVTILGGVRIGRGATVGAGSVVTKDVPPFAVVVGNPARVIRTLENTLDGKGEREGKAEDP
ncbi:MAG: hypothetical protein M1814_006175 [Vezdaea aestivalis]|nr:MAG: hypothetical protein M1814_006175 [Vezdaea aestivalis]